MSWKTRSSQIGSARGSKWLSDKGLSDKRLSDKGLSNRGEVGGAVFPCFVHPGTLREEFSVDRSPTTMIRAGVLLTCMFVTLGLIIGGHVPHIQARQLKRVEAITLVCLPADFEDPGPLFNLCQNVGMLADESIDEWLEPFFGNIVPGGMTRAQEVEEARRRLVSSDLPKQQISP